VRAGQMCAYSDRDELDLGFIPGRDHGTPLPVSLGSAEVGRAYRTPECPVKAGRRVPGRRSDPLALTMRTWPGRQGACAALGQGWSSPTDTWTNSLAGVCN
jgi:hypothetical protein